MTKQNSMRLFMIVKRLLALSLVIQVWSCKKDNPPAETRPPEIAFTMETGEYKVKAGKTIVLEAKVTGAINPVYSWKLDGKIISTALACSFSKDEPGEHFLAFRVDAENGSAEKQAKVSVLAKLPPEITTPTNIIAWAGLDTKLAATALHADSAQYTWLLNGTVVGEDSVYIFNQGAVGKSQITLKVITEDGEDLEQINVSVLPKPGSTLYFDNGRYRVESNMDELRKMTVPLGKTLVLSPVVANIEDPGPFEWTVDGAVQGSATAYYSFTPAARGVYNIVVKEVSTGATAVVQIECAAAEGAYFRPISAGNKASAANGFDFVPAPGQFIDYQIGSTREKALQDLQNALDMNTAPYIGAYGGYFIVGFDHSVKNEPGKADLKIDGNTFAGWSEPGIVWVMQDENGNGLPDDTWYELAGSEAGKPETKQRYAITYYKPSTPQSGVAWTDNLGRTGSVDYNSFHPQAYYFPMFIAEDHYTLTGSCLASTVEVGAMETSAGFPWGYVDNYGDGSKLDFWIEDAIQADGTPASLQYIDFVKVHTGMVGKGSTVGEISTEAGPPIDLHFK